MHLRGKGLGTKFMKSFLKDIKKDVVGDVLYSGALKFWLSLGFEIESVDYFNEYGEIEGGTVMYRCRKDR